MVGFVADVAKTVNPVNLGVIIGGDSRGDDCSEGVLFLHFNDADGDKGLLLYFFGPFDLDSDCDELSVGDFTLLLDNGLFCFDEFICFL